MGFTRKLWVLVGVTAVLSGPAAVARANTNTSVNWSGYAVHRSGVKFRRISGQWIVPTGTCATGYQGFSAFWLGLGGYRLNSQSLEQVGTEFDCNAIGQTQLSAWYELVPAPAHTIHMTVRPGDLISARVVARGHHVTVALTDRTRGEHFHRRVTDRHMDLSSAEWIAEAPSECAGASNCSVLALADFGSVSFMRAFAQTSRYKSGGISSRHWNRTRIFLANTEGRRYVSGSSASSHAVPSRLNRRGRGFTITFSATGTGPGSTAAATSVAGARALARSASAQVRPRIAVLSRQG